MLRHTLSWQINLYKYENEENDDYSAFNNPGWEECVCTRPKLFTIFFVAVKHQSRLNGEYEFKMENDLNWSVEQFDIN